tara:strand:+ start:55 stop:558 length:504 start_codon:yes stop_codon:yes gene_type:complete
MKKYIFLFGILFNLVFVTANAQDKIEKDQLAETVKQSKMDVLMNSKNFEFIANTMFPLGQPPKNLVGSNYSITFSPEMMVSNMPFYGRSFSNMALGRDKGMRFKGKPEIFTVGKENNGYVVEAKVENENDIYTLFLKISESGFATLSIKTNDRQTTAYEGEVVSIQE